MYWEEDSDESALVYNRVISDVIWNTYLRCKIGFYTFTCHLVVPIPKYKFTLAVLLKSTCYLKRSRDWNCFTIHMPFLFFLPQQITCHVESTYIVLHIIYIYKKSILKTLFFSHKSSFIHITKVYFKKMLTIFQQNEI